MIVYHVCEVREHIPLEQGLRRFLSTITLRILNVREHIPLEQGLRHNLNHHLIGVDGMSESIFH